MSRGNSYSLVAGMCSGVFDDGAVGMTWRGLVLETESRRESKATFSAQEMAWISGTLPMGVISFHKRAGEIILIRESPRATYHLSVVVRWPLRFRLWAGIA
jgi:hypothetical protein